MADQWYVAQTQPSSLRIAQRQLEHPTRQGADPLPPVFECYSPAVGSLSLFPGYLFIRFDIDFDPWWHVNRTQGVVKLLPRHLRHPLPLPDGFVEELQGLVLTGAFDPHEVLVRYQPGDVVDVISGAFAGRSGPVASCQKGRIQLLLALLGRKTLVSVPLQDVALRETASTPSADAIQNLPPVLNMA